jgi:hypothetical protein
MSNNRYERKRGNRDKVLPKDSEISFSWTKLDNTQGQSITE